MLEKNSSTFHYLLNTHIHQLLVILRVQVSEQVPAGHLHHRHWKVLGGNIHQPLKQTPCFPAEETKKSNANERSIHRLFTNNVFQKAAIVLLWTLTHLIFGKLYK